MTELELIEGCKRENKHSRHLLYTLYARQMMAICYRYTGSKTVAEDILHDGFLKVFETISRFNYRGEGSLKAWISKIFSNLSLDYLRKNDLINTSIPLENWVEHEISVEDNDVNHVPDNVLMQFIAELPSGYRAVFNLFTFEEKSHREIGEILQINESSSRSQLTRAKAILSKRIQLYITDNE
ncbi:MAG: sigma-70 family RNA polymerase sigma factor [Prevotellaceae bacterium]|jgi:RNA polymerase sigma-70 factor (ECF subfamily)|nr:sigma-70 family RNA polymerase sigma factor [Prevotellaceae bacterium]